MEKRRARGDGSIYEDKARGCWVAQASKTEDGKRFRKAFYGPSEAHVASQMRTWRKAGADDLKAGFERTTVGWVIQQWAAEYQHEIEPETWEGSTSSKINRYLLPLFGHLKLADLRPAGVKQAIRDARRYGTKGAVDISQGQRRHVWRLLNKALNWAVLNKHLLSNPLLGVEGPSVPKVEMRFWLPEQVRKLWQWTEGHRLYALWVTLLTAGPRISEALGLTWDDIDFDRGLCTIRKQVHKRTLKTSKTDSATSKGRTFPMPAMMRAVLAQVPEEERTGHVFKTTNGTPYNKRNVFDDFQDASAAAGLPRIRLHDCRHTVASIALADPACNQLELANMLGHSLPVLLDIYAHLIPGKGTAAAAIDRAFPVVRVA